MKKILCAILALVMCLALCACGGSSAPAAPAATDAPAATEAPAAPETPAEPEATTYKVGICQLMQHAALDAATEGFMTALTDALGDAVEFDLQNAQGDSATCSTIVTGFVANDYDLIMANATPALQAAVSATTTIPILGTSVTDYGTALANPDMDPNAGTGINVSGTSDGVPAQMYADLTLELVPEAKKVSVLYCSAEANSVLQADQYIECMAAAGVECTVFTFSDSNDIQAVCTSAVQDCDAMYIPTDNTAASNMTIVANVCQPAGIPVICGEEGMCGAGGLATVSITYYDIGYECGKQAVAVLSEGADISTMPIGYASNPEKKYNPGFADAIGFEMPEGFAVIE